MKLVRPAHCSHLKPHPTRRECLWDKANCYAFVLIILSLTTFHKHRILRQKCLLCGELFRQIVFDNIVEIVYGKGLLLGSDSHIE